MTEHALERQIRVWLGLFVACLVLSGLTAIPLETETRWLAEGLRRPGPWTHWPALHGWVERVHEGIANASTRYPFLAYGTDWLAFAHMVIAIAFCGAIRDPVRNTWVVEFGIIACLAIIPFVLVFGPLRGIPWFWQCIDMSFGLFGLVPLWVARRAIRRLRALRTATQKPDERAVL
jgi:hypothetical protein